MLILFLKYNHRLIYRPMNRVTQKEVVLDKLERGFTLYFNGSNADLKPSGTLL